MSLELRAKSLEEDSLLPVHGFVLAGGKSSRMGKDKALLKISGSPLIQIAVEKLRSFCADVSIVGNRDDLVAFAPVVHEARLDAGPAAGIEAGLGAATQPWTMFVPVDVPLVPAELLHAWAARVIESPEFERTSGPLMGCSLYTQSGPEPAFVMLRPETLKVLAEGLDNGERRLDGLFANLRSAFGDARYLRMDAAWFVTKEDVERIPRWFSNVNTPEEFDATKVLASEESHPSR